MSEAGKFKFGALPKKVALCPPTLKLLRIFFTSSLEVANCERFVNLAANAAANTASAISPRLYLGTDGADKDPNLIFLLLGSEVSKSKSTAKVLFLCPTKVIN